MWKSDFQHEYNSTVKRAYVWQTRKKCYENRNSLLNPLNFSVDVLSATQMCWTLSFSMELHFWSKKRKIFNQIRLFCESTFKDATRKKNRSHTYTFDRWNGFIYYEKCFILDFIGENDLLAHVFDKVFVSMWKSFFIATRSHCSSSSTSTTKMTEPINTKTWLTLVE